MRFIRSPKHASRRPVLLPLLLVCVLATASLLLVALPSAPATDFVPDDTPPCARALIFTGARQGSTWFVDSLERCRYSSAGAGTPDRRYADDVFKRTELWKHFGEPHLDGSALSADDALRYIVTNSSVKIFPSVYYRRKADVVHMLRQRDKFNLAVFVLRRHVNATWDSWVRAQNSNVWNGAKKEHEAELNQTLYDVRDYFFDSRQRYDENVDAMLDGFQVQYDLFDYDDIKDKALIYARNNACFIRNCNYVQSQEADAEPSK